MKLILDSDLNFPSDDSGALLLLLGDPRHTLVACSAAAGNTWAEEVEVNLGSILQLVGASQVAIASGPSHVLFTADREVARTARALRLRSFVGAHEKAPRPRQWVIRAPGTPRDCPRGPQLMVDLCGRFPGEVQLVCTGPLTNLAQALALEPRLVTWVDRVYVMGGCLEPDATAGGEIDFNFWFDPQAAKVVLASGLPILLLPADVCRTTRATAGLTRVVRSFSRGRAGLFADEFSGMQEQHGADMPLVDQLLALIVREPSIATNATRGNVDVVTSGPWRGQSVLNPHPEGPVRVVRAADSARVEHLLHEALGAMDLRAPRPLPRLASLRGQYQHELARQSEPADEGPPHVVQVERHQASPILHCALAGLEGAAGDNINGPSLVRSPPWATHSLGRYYLYFAHHRGRSIRLATADSLAGPWRVHPSGVLDAQQTPCELHIASPDVHVDPAGARVLMYYHGKQPGRGPQRTYLAISRDGLRFASESLPLGPPYFRVFRYGGFSYAICKTAEGAQLLRSRSGFADFEPGPALLPRCRHTAVSLRGDYLWILFSRIGDAPEHLFATRLDLRLDWRAWPDTLSTPQSLLSPTLSWEGADHENERSTPGPATGVKQLRDPAVFLDDDGAYLVYAGAGEEALGLATLSFT